MNAPHSETDVESRLRQAIQEAVGPDRYDLWLSETRWEQSASELRIVVRETFRLEYLETRLRQSLEAALLTFGTQNAISPLTLQLVLADPLEAASLIACENSDPSSCQAGISQTPEGGAAQSAHASRATSSKNVPQTEGPRRRFAKLEDLIAGPCNQVGVASARMVLDQPGKLSPLYIYGPTGVGKTHLVQGLWCEFQRRNGRGRHVYLTSEQFTSFFLEALHGRGIPSFRRRYRELDLLIVEDVQFFANKRATLDELQYTIDAVARDGGQVVLSSDRSPADLEHFGGELANRFAGGLVARMTPVDVETRIGIVERLIAGRGLRVPRDVIEALAERLTDDARKLIGAVNRLQAYSLATHKEIDMALATEALDDILQAATRSVQLLDIERAVCSMFGIVAKELRSENRARMASHPRMVAMWLARKHTRSALSEIGEFFGRKSHSTVLAAERKVADWVGTKQRIRVQDRDCRADEAIRQIERKLRVG